MKTLKLLYLSALACFVGCADLQDAMPGMSYSDRTLLEGIQACASYSMEKAVADLDGKKLGDKFWSSKADELHDFESILTKLKREAELKEIRVLLNETIATVLKQEAVSFNKQVGTLNVSEDPEFLMESSNRAITDYYMGSLKVQGQVGDVILKVMKENGAQEKFLKLKQLYNDIPYLEDEFDLALHSQLSSFLLAEITERMAHHEQELRRNPLLRKTKILKKTFADYDPV